MREPQEDKEELKLCWMDDPKALRERVKTLQEELTSAKTWIAVLEGRLEKYE